MSGQIVINEIRASDSAVEILNTGGSTVNISSYWLCRFPNYSQTSSLTVLCGDLNLAPGALVTVDLNYTLDPQDDELGLYLNGDFGNSASIIDYVEWGSHGHTRSLVAEAAGIWTDGDFVPSWDDCASLEYDGAGDASSDWSAQNAPTMPCIGNDLTGCGTMPIELLSFEAREMPEGNGIYWTAIHDPTVDRIWLEHSENTTTWSFASSWIMRGPGFDQGKFIHRDISAGMHYYRLYITYLDGSSEHSHIASAEFCNENDVIDIRPNPARDQLHITLTREADDLQVEVLLLNPAGQIVERKLVHNHTAFDLSALPEGIYVVQIPAKGVSRRVLKQ